MPPDAPNPQRLADEAIRLAEVFERSAAWLSKGTLAGPPRTYPLVGLADYQAAAALLRTLAHQLPAALDEAQEREAPYDAFLAWLDGDGKRLFGAVVTSDARMRRDWWEVWQAARAQLAPAVQGAAVAWLVYLPSIQTGEVFFDQDDDGYVDWLTNYPDAVVTPLYEQAPPAVQWQQPGPVKEPCVECNGSGSLGGHGWARVDCAHCKGTGAAEVPQWKLVSPEGRCWWLPDTPENRAAITPLASKGGSAGE